jgi:hypothetical protein
MHTRRGYAPVIDQAVLFSSATQCNLLPSKVYKNYTTTNSLLFQTIWLAGIDKSSMYMHQKRMHTSDLPSSVVFLYSIYNLLSTEVNKNCTTNSHTAVQRSSSCCCFVIYCLLAGGIESPYMHHQKLMLHQ